MLKPPSTMISCSPTSIMATSPLPSSKKWIAKSMERHRHLAHAWLDRGPVGAPFSGLSPAPQRGRRDGAPRLGSDHFLNSNRGHDHPPAGFSVGELRLASPLPPPLSFCLQSGPGPLRADQLTRIKSLENSENADRFCIGCPRPRERLAIPAPARGRSSRPRGVATRPASCPIYRRGFPP